MAAREQEGKGNRGDKAAPGSRAPAPRGKAGNDAVLRALAEVEQTLARLKQVRAERAEAEAAFKAEIAERDAREQELKAASERAAVELEEARARVGALEAELDQFRALEESACGRLEQELEDAVAARAALAERVTVLEGQVREAGEARERLEAELARAEGARAELESVRAAEQELRRGFDELQERVTSLAGQVEELGREAERWKGEAGAAAEEAERLRARASALEEELLSARDASGGQVEALRAEAAGARARVSELEAALDEQRRAAAEKRSEAEESLRNAEILAAKVGEQEQRIGELGEALDAARRDSAALQEGEDSAAARLAGLSAELEQSRGECARLRADCDAALEAAAESERRAAAAEAAATADAAQARERLERELGEARAQVEELRAGADADGSLKEELQSLRARLGGLEAERSALVGERDAGREELEARRLEIESLHEKLERAAEQLVALQGELAERDERMAVGGDEQAEIARLRGELETARAQAAASAQELGGGGDPARLALRRARLARARRLLRERSGQFNRATAMLSDRVRQCDELIARRRELVQAREIIEKTHRKVVGSRARSSAAAVIFFAVGLLVVLAGASWAVVSQFFPATYAASAVLSADFRGVTPGAGEAEGWQEFHEQLLFDPQLMGRVAERMRQRGFEDLAAPAAVKVKLEQDLTWSGPEPGKLVLELRGPGREATTRMLDTYVTTLEVEANALRQKRTDSAQTIVAERARVGTEPVFDDRPARAAIGLAGAVGVSLLLWVGIWRRMVKSKQAFENSTQIDHLLEDARWADPIQRIIEARGDDSTAEKAA